MFNQTIGRKPTTKKKGEKGRKGDIEERKNQCNNQRTMGKKGAEGEGTTTTEVELFICRFATLRSTNEVGKSCGGKVNTFASRCLGSVRQMRFGAWRKES
jgi:hypothetical protein